jgi:hypothetical protein
MKSVSSEKSNCFRPPPGATSCRGPENDAAAIGLSTGTHSLQKSVFELPSSSSGRIERAHWFSSRLFVAGKEDCLTSSIEALLRRILDPPLLLAVYTHVLPLLMH